MDKGRPSIAARREQPPRSYQKNCVPSDISLQGISSGHAHCENGLEGIQKKSPPGGKPDGPVLKNPLYYQNTKWSA
jgi:hypothetical protein